MRIEVVLKGLEILAWPAAAVVIVSIVAVLLWKLRHRLSKLTLKAKDYELFIEMSERKLQESLPDPGETVFSQNELRDTLEAIPGLDKSELSERLDFAFGFLRRSGVVTKNQLAELTNSIEIRDALNRIYIEELNRQVLDPVAIATWGAFLYLYGVSDENIVKVREWVRQFPEYKGVKQPVSERADQV